MIQLLYQSVAKRRVHTVCTKGLRSISLACAATHSSRGACKAVTSKTAPSSRRNRSPGGCTSRRRRSRPEAGAERVAGKRSLMIQLHTREPVGKYGNHGSPCAYVAQDSDTCTLNEGVYL